MASDAHDLDRNFALVPAPAISGLRRSPRPRRSTPVLLEALESRLLLNALSVLANGQLIPNGSSAYSMDNFTDYGYTKAGDSSFALTRTYTLQDTDGGSVNLTGTPRVTISGANASEFTVTTQPAATTLDATHSTTITITFTPTAAGLRSATVTIANTGTGNPFTFSIHGTALAGATNISGYNTTIAQIAPGYGQPSSFGSGAGQGDYLVVNYTLYTLDGTKADSSLNPGRTPFTFQLGAGQVITGWEVGMYNLQYGEQRVLMVPASEGYGSAGSGSIPPNANLIFTVQRLQSIEFFGSTGTYINSGGTSTNASDGTNFGITGINGSAITQTYYLTVPGAPPYIYPYSAVVPNTPFANVTGPDAAQFSVSGLLSNSTGTYITVTFTPGATTGTRNATVNIPTFASEDKATGYPDNYSFAIQATVRIPGDANGDNHIDINDFMALDRGYLRHLTGYANGDFDNSGTIDSADYQILNSSLQTNGHPQTAGALTTVATTVLSAAALPLSAAPSPTPASPPASSTLSAPSPSGVTLSSILPSPPRVDLQRTPLDWNLLAPADQPPTPEVHPLIRILRTPRPALPHFARRPGNAT